MTKIKITQVKSGIDRPERQKLTLRALGLNKLNASREVEATAQILGMVRKVNHLIKIEEAGAGNDSVNIQNNESQEINKPVVNEPNEPELSNELITTQPQEAEAGNESVVAQPQEPEVSVFHQEISSAPGESLETGNNPVDDTMDISRPESPATGLI